jgi:hypothetical protein
MEQLFPLEVSQLSQVTMKSLQTQLESGSVPAAEAPYRTRLLYFCFILKMR